MTNTETLSHHPNHPKSFLFLGGLSEIGEDLTRKLILDGREVILGTRTPQKLEEFKKEITAKGSRAHLSGFVADLTNPVKVEEAYNSLQLKPDVLIHLLLWPVSAMSPQMIFAIGRKIATACRDNEKNIDEVTKNENIKRATQGIKTIVQTPGALDNLMRLNDGMLHIVDLLVRDGHLTEVSTLSSGGSNVCNPDTYPGPWFYYPIAYPKQRLVLSLQEKAQETGFNYINFVAPPVKGTKIVAWFNKLIAKVYPDTVFYMPTITKADLVETLFNQLVCRGSERQQIETVYIRGLNEVSPTRPPEWNIQYPF